MTSPDDSEAPRTARAWTTYFGDLAGEGEASLIILSTGLEGGAQSAGYIATERIIARLHDRSGRFTVQHGGVRTRGRMRSTFGRIVEGSGTRELRGLRGTVNIERQPDGLHTVRIEYDFAPLLPWEATTGHQAADMDSSPNDPGADGRPSGSGDE